MDLFIIRTWLDGSTPGRNISRCPPNTTTAVKVGEEEAAFEYYFRRKWVLLRATSLQLGGRRGDLSSGVRARPRQGGVLEEICIAPDRRSLLSSCAASIELLRRRCRASNSGSAVDLRPAARFTREKYTTGGLIYRVCLPKEDPLGSAINFINTNKLNLLEACLHWLAQHEHCMPLHSFFRNVYCAIYLNKRNLHFPKNKCKAKGINP